MHKRHLHILWIIVSALLFSLALSSCQKDDSPSSEEEDDSWKNETPPSLLSKVEGRNVVAYCTWYGTAIPDTKAVTQINYAFAELYVSDGVYKGFKLQGEESRFKSIVDLKKEDPSLKILISFTHTVENSDNSQGGGFSSMSSTEGGRKAFAEDCLAFCQKWGIDGVDIDWEFPGISWSGHASDPINDSDNFTLLIRQLRETLGKDYMVTFAGYVMNRKQTSSGGWRYMDLSSVKDYVDYIYIMTYDLDEAPYHHSAIDDSRAYWDWTRTFTAYVQAGVPKEKMVFGVPFYARHAFSGSTTAINYKKIKTLDSNVYNANCWDSKAQCPYISVKSTGAFYAGYDNPRSIAIKAKWVMNLGLGGLMYWQYDADDAKGNLRTAVWNGIMGY